MRIIQFTHYVAPYNPGETASFPDDRAAHLIGLGAAVEYVTKETKPEPQPVAGTDEPSVGPKKKSK